MVGTAAAQQTSDETENSSVDVTVSETTAVDIQPANLEYSADVGARSTSSARGFGAIEIENTGSTYINRIWLNSSVPNSDPFGTGNANNYDAGNLIEVKSTSDLPGQTSTDSNFRFINRKEYMYTGDSIPSYIQTPSDWNDEAVAPIRRGNETIYAAVEADSGSCNGDASNEIRVGNVSATDTRLGTVDFTESSEYGWTNYSIGGVQGASEYGLAVSDQGGYFEDGSGNELAGVALNYTYTDSGNPVQYDMLTSCENDGSDGANAVRVSYNIGAEGADDIKNNNGEVTSYLVEETNSDETAMLAPGALATIQTAINVPEGVAAGSVDPGTLRVLITSDKGAETDP